MFDIEKLKSIEPRESRYDRRIGALKQKGSYTQSIETAVTGAMGGLASGSRAFVIYGEPQSGKTEMMIALTAKLLDSGFRIVVVLLNDSVQLLNQNLTRFRASGLDPAPRSFAEILDAVVDVREGEFVIFCKKNQSDLNKLIGKLGHIEGKVVIDDEADYATPNAKVNAGQRTKINELVGRLLGNNGKYIGVTATPARLDLNRTFENESERWVDFPPHPDYKGQEFFFPAALVDLQNPGFRLTALPDNYDLKQHLREAMYGFFVNVAYLNTNVNDVEECYSILIHTSGKRADHSDDYKQVVKLFNVLKSPSHVRYQQYVRELWDVVQKRYPGHEDRLTAYIVQNINRHVVVVMNSDFDKRNMDYETATEPTTLFTVAIGGNIVSRGVTFNRLLSMFFTRDVKHRIQQDTYIQRARMFGVRTYDLRHFELTIPESLYLDWHRCFIFHRLALASIRAGNGSPIWLEDRRIAAVSRASVNRAMLSMNSGEMSFGVFDYEASIEEIILQGESALSRLEKLANRLGDSALPTYLLSYIRAFVPHGDDSIALHASKSIEGYGDADKGLIAREKGLIGKSDREEQKFPRAIHHIKIFHNSRGKARVFYRYQGSISFLRMRGRTGR
ncbi:MAG: Z1 domain-containing protein [Dehalococcoidia bacterium]